MASCQPKVPGVRYWDESWWQEFFTKDLAEFYASLNGLLRARDPARYEALKGEAEVKVHPLFYVVEGDVEPWERVKAFS